MAHFINLMNKRYNAEQINSYELAYIGHNPVIQINFMDGSMDNLYFDNGKERDQYIADMDRKLGANNA